MTFRTEQTLRRTNTCFYTLPVQIEHLSFLRAKAQTADVRNAILFAFLSSYITTMKPTQNLTPTFAQCLLFVA